VVVRGQTSLVPKGFVIDIVVAEKTRFGADFVQENSSMSAVDGIRLADGINLYDQTLNILVEPTQAFAFGYCNLVETSSRRCLELETLAQVAVSIQPGCNTALLEGLDGALPSKSYASDFDRLAQ